MNTNGVLNDHIGNGKGSRKNSMGIGWFQRSNETSMVCVAIERNYLVGIYRFHWHINVFLANSRGLFS